MNDLNDVRFQTGHRLDGNTAVQHLLKSSVCVLSLVMLKGRHRPMRGRRTRLRM